MTSTVHACLSAAADAARLGLAEARPGSDTHRLVDLAAGAVFAASGLGALRDLHDRPITLDTDLTRRWSGVHAATEQLADEIVGIARGALGATPPESPPPTYTTR